MHAILDDVTRLRNAAVSVRYAVRSIPEAWVLPEGTVPESIPHDEAAEYLKLVLRAWAARSPRNVRVARNLAVRWLEEMPQIGIDPDVCVLEPPPPDADDLGSLRLWQPGHRPPALCIEVVNANHPHKDYAAIQDRYAAIGTAELVVFDPLLAGPPALGGPVSLQLWRRDDVGLFERVHFGERPAYSNVLEAWLVPDGRLLRIKDDLHASDHWPTGEERERAEKERERAEKESVIAGLAELERRLAAQTARGD
jgi:Uma2 family endonuclease